MDRLSVPLAEKETEFRWDNDTKQLLLQKGDEFSEFRGTSQHGWVNILDKVYNKNGNHSYSDFHLRTAPGVVIWQYRNNKYISRGTDRYPDILLSNLNNWGELPPWCQQEVIRHFSPKTAARLDSNSTSAVAQIENQSTNTYTEPTSSHNLDTDTVIHRRSRD